MVIGVIQTEPGLLSRLFFCDKNLGFNWQNDYFINLDKNSYDVIYMRVNDIDFKQCHQYLENSLKKIITKYRVNQLNQKIDISINNNENDDKEIDEDSKIKKKLEILEIHIKLGNYQKSLEYLNILIKRSFYYS